MRYGNHPMSDVLRGKVENGVVNEWKVESIIIQTLSHCGNHPMTGAKRRRDMTTFGHLSTKGKIMFGVLARV